MTLDKYAEGKTKIIWSTAEKEVVLIESKDDITAGDGARRDIIEHKGILATETTCNCFSLLNTRGIPTHFLERESERRFLARRVKMIPIELVVRRIAKGSYPKRHPEVVEGTVFDNLIFESFYKDDSLHDPLMVWDERMGTFVLYNAKVPVGKGYLFNLRKNEIISPQGRPLDKTDMDQLREIACNVFLILEKAWKEIDVVLVDLKIECGWTSDSPIVVADVIDNDSWRIWPSGDKSQMKDKQVYRDLEGTTAEALGEIKNNYAWVAAATKRFIQ